MKSLFFALGVLMLSLLRFVLPVLFALLVYGCDNSSCGKCGGGCWDCTFPIDYDAVLYPAEDLMYTPAEVLGQFEGVWIGEGVEIHVGAVEGEAEFQRVSADSIACKVPTKAFA